MAVCEGCLQDKDVTNIEGNLLCEECTKDVVRCSFCNKFLAINYDDLDTNLGKLTVPELTLPDIQEHLIFEDVDCLERYIKKYKKEHKECCCESGGHDSDISKLFDKWVLYIQKLYIFHKGFEVFTDKSDKLSVKDLREIIRGGTDALDEKIDSVRDYNEDIEYQMFKSTIRTFLSDEGVDENIIEEEEKFREEFEGYVRWNIEKLFDFPVLLMENKRYEVAFNGVSNEIDPSYPGQLEFHDKAVKYLSEAGLQEILANSWDGSGFFGIIVNGSDIIRAIKDKKNTIYSNEMVIGIHDGFNGSGYFKRVDNSKISDTDNQKEFGIDLDKAELDWGKYSLGAVYGTIEWRYE